MCSSVDTSVLESVRGRELIKASLIELDGIRCGIVLFFSGDFVISITAIEETDEVKIHASPENVTRPHKEPTNVLKSRIGHCLLNWWTLTNDANLCDGVMLAFAPNSGLLFSVMASEVHISEVSGEQIA